MSKGTILSRWPYRLAIAWHVGLLLAVAAPAPRAGAQVSRAVSRGEIREALLQARASVTEHDPAATPSASMGSGPKVPAASGPRTVRVRCAAGETIGDALKKKGQPLVVEIGGVCREDVVVERDDVTLRGSDPLTDGVRGVGPGVSNFDGVVEVRRARGVTIENLTVTGGDRSGIAVDRSDNVTIRNCHVRDNGTRGLLASFSSNVAAFDSTFARNGLAELRPYNTRALNCTGCTVEASQNGVLAAGSEVGLTNSSVVAPFLALLLYDGLAFVTGSTMRDSTPDTGFSITALDFGSISFFESELHGALAVSDGAMFLSDTTQATNARGVNAVIGGRIVAYGTSSLLATGALGTLMEEFGNLTLYDDTVAVTGSLECFAGGDASCASPAQVSGTSTCGQCPKP